MRPLPPLLIAAMAPAACHEPEDTALHESLVNKGRDADAEWVKHAFDEPWKDADTRLTIEAL